MTVEGWIKRGDYAALVYKDRVGASVVLGVAYDSLSPAATVVFLAEPVQFKDGDVVKHREPSLWLRHGGQWYAGGPTEDGVRFGDENVRVWLAKGLAVRLVPEANGD